MAEVSRSKKANPLLLGVGKSFKDRLTLLGCPYTDGVDETWIAELLFQQGEARIRLLHWLFSRYDEKLANLLDDQYYGSEARVDSRLQKLLSISSMLGLCQPNDIDLIRGSASSSKQAAFWDRLLDVISAVEMSEDPLSDARDLSEQSGHDNLFLTSLAHQKDIHEVFSSTHPLLPPDLMKMIKHRAAEHHEATGKKANPPPIKELDDQLFEINNNLRTAKERLEDVKSKFSFEETPVASKETVCQTLKLVLTEMSQLITSFTHTFEAEMRPWCNKDPPRLTPLGPSSKRVNTYLTQFRQLLEDLKTIRSSFEHLQRFSANSKADETTSETLGTIAFISESAMQTCSDLTGILEDSSHTGHTESMLEPTI